jgi:hypothetical protein
MALVFFLDLAVLVFFLVVLVSFLMVLDSFLVVEVFFLVVLEGHHVWLISVRNISKCLHEPRFLRSLLGGIYVDVHDEVRGERSLIFRQPLSGPHDDIVKLEFELNSNLKMRANICMARRISLAEAAAAKNQDMRLHTSQIVGRRPSSATKRAKS